MISHSTDGTQERVEGSATAGRTGNPGHISGIEEGSCQSGADSQRHERLFELRLHREVICFVDKAGLPVLYSPPRDERIPPRTPAVMRIDTKVAALPSGCRVAYRVAGEGPVVLLLHGWAASWRLWRGAMLALADAGYCAVAPDHVGCGDSDKPLVAYTPATYAAYLASFVDVLGLDRFDIAGHSLGGHIALSYALAHGERLRRLVLVNPAYSPLRQMSATRAELLLVTAGLPVVGEMALALTPVRLLRWILGRPWGGFHMAERLPAGFLDDIVADYLMRASPLVANSILYLVLFSLPGLAALKRDADLRPRLAELALPVMVVWGERDALLSPRSFADSGCRNRRRHSVLDGGGGALATRRGATAVRGCPAAIFERVIGKPWLKRDGPVAAWRRDSGRLILSGTGVG